MSFTNGKTIRTKVHICATSRRWRFAAKYGPRLLDHRDPRGEIRTGRWRRSFGVCKDPSAGDGARPGGCRNIRNRVRILQQDRLDNLTTAASATTVAGGTGSTPTTAGSTGGSGSSVTVGGKAITANFTTSCAKQAGNPGSGAVRPKQRHLRDPLRGGHRHRHNRECGRHRRDEGWRQWSAVCPRLWSWGAWRLGVGEQQWKHLYGHRQGSRFSNLTGSPVSFTAVFACSTVVGG